MMAGLDIPIKAIREYICSAIDIVVHIERLADGRRKITSISEISEIKGDNLKLREIFAFNKKGLLKNGEVDGEFILYNGIPEVYNKIKAKGITDLETIWGE